MNKTKKQDTKNQKMWLAISGIATIAAITSYLIASAHTSSSTVSNNVSGMYAGWATLGSLVALLLCLIGCFKVRKWSKAVPIVCAILCLMVVCLAYFAYSFSDYGSRGY